MAERRVPTRKKKTNPGKPVQDSHGGAVVACDLFAGAGGFSLGAYLAGIEVAAAVEMNENACDTYRSNLISTGLTATQLFERDITELSPGELKKKSGLASKKCDILLGGPPCQGFSAHRLNDSGVNDPRNALLLRYFEYVRVLRPAFFLVENVPGMLWPRHKTYVDSFYSLAKAARYDLLDPIILNARDYGVPQNRRRVFILGYDRRRIDKVSAWPPNPTHVAPDSELPLLHWQPASVVFERRILRSDPNGIHMSHGEELTEIFARTPHNGGSRKDSGRVLPCHENHVGHRDVYGRINPSVPAPTMTTACINPSKGRFVHPTEDHGISLRHAARIQSFPDWFNFEGGLMAGGIQVGNAVPVDLATALLVPLQEAVLALRSVEELSAVA
ncbi:MAG TPA: DNA cytosine methyltransferase [Acidobacteriaceae bacterium]|jgi:DNA (cytosine-5)-methyltransferase 1|nr:DNA cytosine methyltransferase [Acidobacteriaceae bacterium]